ncbi:Crp/Fnr family transcriptional regulator [Bacillus sp. ISL-40]|uniref:Crp/Fnr family transcriptional regulator n=1 Tax=unclassified Bacillus (in: firmicutes) TaxID=185979 RepID=UPI001BE5C7B9|nr:MULTISPECIES: Crp/Fnr family transcriptional regulator [unclassified Bacillus (in: firmicutes)]MBT2701564.1 Crp/Fnr family transcriptional regulator [Bacillus sp. ISL-40]MBT2725009.1 Crp/Fnr family transcriptional regulator [Bacillus sp. ISL-46]MBT2740560.1 Crp/Fnr family transcriptional regulator [Bacillus sp. ISL-77]
MQKSSYSIYNLLVYFYEKKEPIQKIKAGSVLFQEKDPAQYVFLLLKGSISLGRVHLRGKDFILKILNGQELIVEYQLFKPFPHYQFYAKTMTDCEMIFIKKEQFEEFIKNDPEAMSALVAWLSTGYLKAQMKCQDLIMNGKKGGLYSILIRLSNTYGIKTEDGILIDLPLTHQELANLTYGTREVIQRALKDLREKEIITYDNQKFTIKKLNYLKEEVDCQNCSFEICGLN